MAKDKSIAELLSVQQKRYPNRKKQHSSRWHFISLYLFILCLPKGWAGWTVRPGQRCPGQRWVSNILAKFAENSKTILRKDVLRLVLTFYAHFEIEVNRNFYFCFYLRRLNKKFLTVCVLTAQIREKRSKFNSRFCVN